MTITVGAGVLLVILFQVLLILYKRRKKSTAVNIPMETVDTPQEPLRNDQVNCELPYEFLFDLVQLKHINCITFTNFYAQKRSDVRRNHYHSNVNYMPG